MMTQIGPGIAPGPYPILWNRIYTVLVRVDR